jgi:transcriptional regulator with XRE-family HTH domain
MTGLALGTSAGPHRVEEEVLASLALSALGKHSIDPRASAVPSWRTTAGGVRVAGGEVVWWHQPSDTGAELTLFIPRVGQNRLLPRIAEPSAAETSARVPLETLRTRARLSVDELAELLGASRRSIYNWLDDRMPAPEMMSRITRVLEVLEPVIASRHPARVRQWLLAGPEPPATLVSSDRFSDLAALVAADTAPLVSVDTLPPRLADDDDVLGPETLAALWPSLERRAARIGDSERSPWRPRELTGWGLDDDPGSD